VQVKELVHEGTHVTDSELASTVAESPKKCRSSDWFVQLNMVVGCSFCFACA